MKIAISINENGIIDEFGKSSSLHIFEINEDFQIIDRTEEDLTNIKGCKSKIAPHLAELDVHFLITTSLGHGAKYIMDAYGLIIKTNYTGNAENCLNEFIKDIKTSK
ncbi:MAG: hypothetical protein HXX09_14390 [Bacteroidetes bacterium]|nr:hypothetical protein [Bacteroidota bacterium]